MAQRSSTTREDREREREREKEKVQAHVAWGERDYSEGGGGRPSRHGAPAVAPSESAARWLKPVVDPKGLQAELNGGVAPVVEETPAQLKQRMFPSQFFAASAGSTVPVTNPTLAPHDPHAERMAAYARAVAETAPSAAAVAAPAGPLRPDLTCSLCGDYFSSASVLGCCYTSFCLECIQQHLQVRTISTQTNDTQDSLFEGDQRAGQASADDSSFRKTLQPLCSFSHAMLFSLFVSLALCSEDWCLSFMRVD